MVIALCIAAIVLLLALPGCERRARSELVVWTDMASGEIDAVRALCAEFTAANGMPVKIVRIPFEELQPKFQVAAPIRQGPDLITGPHDWIGPFATAGLIAPPALTDEDRAPYIDVALQDMSFAGKLYGLPLSLDTLCLMYNRDLIAEPPTTMKELIEKAKALTKGDVSGFLFDITDFYFTVPFYYGYGGYVFKESPAGFEPTDLGLDNKGSLEATQFLVDLQNVHHLIPQGTKKDIANGRFLSGNLAMTINGPWARNDYAKKKLNFGVARIPRLDNGRWPAPFVGVMGVMLSATSHHPEQALSLMKSLSGKKAQVAIYKAGGRIPTRTDAIRDPEVAEDRDVPAIQDAASVGTPMPNIPELTQVWQPMKEALELVTTNKQTPEEALRDAVTRMRKNIRMMME